MGAHPAPAELQRSHSLLNAVGEPVQVPVLAVSVWPSCAVPEIAGRLTFDGARNAAVTTAVWGEVAGAEEPAVFEATTDTRSVLPTSAEPTVYVGAVAPSTALQLPPSGPQRFHA